MDQELSELDPLYCFCKQPCRLEIRRIGFIPPIFTLCFPVEFIHAKCQRRSLHSHHGCDYQIKLPYPRHGEYFKILIQESQGTDTEPKLREVQLKRVKSKDKRFRHAK